MNKKSCQNFFAFPCCLLIAAVITDTEVPENSDIYVYQFNGQNVMYIYLCMCECVILRLFNA